MSPSEAENAHQLVQYKFLWQENLHETAGLLFRVVDGSLELEVGAEPVSSG